MKQYKHKTSSFFTVLWSFAVIMILAIQPVGAVDDLGLFELEGNAVHNGWGSPGDGDDWATLYGGPGSADIFTGITADPAPMSIFDGGKKDIQEVQGVWSWKHGSVPDKNDITNAYAAAYTATANMGDTVAGDTIIYFGADRFANTGDAFLGFWFFKNEIIAEDDGSFSGFHALGDILVLVNFPQGANAEPLIQVISWVPTSTCSKADNNNPQPGDCAAKHLFLEAGASGAGAVCNGSGGLFCAVTNDENGLYDPTDSPWAYIPKAGPAGSFPYESIFEGGINLSQLFPDSDGCFSSFLAETRSSSSFTASLKDFVLDSFPLCSIEVSKVCSNPVLNVDDTITYDITGTVTNTGPGTVYNIVVVDTPAFGSGPVYNGDPLSLAGNATLDYSGTITVPLSSVGPTDRIDATANTRLDNTGTVLMAYDEFICPSLQVNPAASVIKNCDSVVSIIDLVDPVQPGVVAEVNVGGMVCNTGDSRLDQVTVTDNKAGVLLGPISMEKSTCENYTGSYIPVAALDNGGTQTQDPTAVVFKDTVTVTAVDIFGEDLAAPLPTAMATCPLCPVPE